MINKHRLTELRIKAEQAMQADAGFDSSGGLYFREYEYPKTPFYQGPGPFLVGTKLPLREREPQGLETNYTYAKR